MKLFTATTLAAATALAAPALAQDTAQDSASAGNPEAQAVEMKMQDGSSAGTASLIPTPRGVLIEAQLSGLPEGVHGFHIHETGTCEGDFTSAGGHYNPSDAEHGYLAENGPHPGDMPNFTAASDGSAKFSVFNPMVMIEGGEAPLNDSDGSALMVHSGADDYISQPSGDAGDRIACGVIYPAQSQ